VEVLLLRRALRDVLLELEPDYIPEGRLVISHHPYSVKPLLSAKKQKKLNISKKLQKLFSGCSERYTKECLPKGSTGIGKIRFRISNQKRNDVVNHIRKDNFFLKKKREKENEVF